MRQVSPAALQAMMAQSTPEVFVPLLRIEHPDLDAPVLLAYNTDPVVRSDGTYRPCAFEIPLPEQGDDESLTTTVTVDNTDLEVNEKIRTLTGQPKVTFMVVLASSPDTVEAGPFEMNLQQAQANAQTIQGNLGYEMDVFAQDVPGQDYLPGTSPGLFA